MGTYWTSTCESFEGISTPLVLSVSPNPVKRKMIRFYFGVNLHVKYFPLTYLVSITSSLFHDIVNEIRNEEELYTCKKVSTLLHYSYLSYKTLTQYLGRVGQDQ